MVLTRNQTKELQQENDRISQSSKKLQAQQKALDGISRSLSRDLKKCSRHFRNAFCRYMQELASPLNRVETNWMRFVSTYNKVTQRVIVQIKAKNYPQVRKMLRLLWEATDGIGKDVCMTEVLASRPCSHLNVAFHNLQSSVEKLEKTIHRMKAHFGSHSFLSLMTSPSYREREQRSLEMFDE